MKREIKFGKMLDFFRQEKNMTMEELGAYLGRNKSTVSRWISGERYPKIEEVEQIVNFFDTDVETLLFGADKVDKKNSILALINETSSQLTPPRQQKVYNFAKGELRNQKNEDKNISVLEHRKIEENNVPKGHYVKVVALASAGHGCYAFEKENTYTVWVNSVPPNYDLAFQISGNSMEPIFRHNEVIFVKRVSHLYTGQIGVIEINNEIFVKKVHHENNRLKLISLNTAVNKKNERLYPDFYADEKDEIYIIGKVIM